MISYNSGVNIPAITVGWTIDLGGDILCVEAVAETKQVALLFFV